MASTTAHILLPICLVFSLLHLSFGARVLSNEQQPVVEDPSSYSLLKYHQGPLLSGKISVNLIWYGKFTPTHRGIVSDFITSLSSTKPHSQPSVAKWWSSIAKYYHLANQKPPSLSLVLGKQLLDESYSLGKSLTNKHLVELASKGDHVNSINVVLTASDVAVDGFCSSRCGTHGSSYGPTAAKGKRTKFAYIWVGNSEIQCPGQCAWPFHQPIYGPQSPPLVAPNNDVGLDGMVINFAQALAAMLECRSCALRCMRAIAGDAAFARQPLQQRLLLTPHLQQRPSRRALSTTATRPDRDGDALDAYGDAFDDIEFDEASTARTPAVVTETQKQLRKAKGVQVENKKSLQMELRFLKDPLKLSEHVKYTLRCEKPEKALELCRLASKDMNCVVSWNAVIDWHMRKLKINEALKVYNEMKKRAQFPDSYTYMMVLRGLGFRSNVSETVREENVSKAIAIYTSMNAPTSRVRPTIMHTNATLNVCAQALDMDALWSIAGQIPQKGPNAPDRLTYTIILNAIRHSAYGKNPEDVQLEQIAARRQKAVDEGRRVWLDIIRKWRSGELIIDEDLVGSMGRLLLTSKRVEDWDNVLDLVQQTMNIERLIAPVGSPERFTDHVPQEDVERAVEALRAEVDEEGYTNSSAAQAFKVVKPTQPEHAQSKGPRPLIWAKPGPQTVSLLVDACQQMRIPRIASAYWDVLTSGDHSVAPDLENFDRQLRLYASNRASAKAAKLLREDLPAAGIEPKNSTFRLAMSACQRDMKNPHVLEHATTIIDVMEKTCPDPDPNTLMSYLSLSLTTNDGPKIVAVINRMDSIVHNLRSRVNYGTDRKISPEADIRDIKQAAMFLQALIGTIDTLINRQLVPSEDYREWIARRGDLNKFLGLVKTRVERRQRRLAPGPEGDKKLGKPLGLMMGKDAWETRMFRYNNPELKERRRENLRQERDATFNPRRYTPDNKGGDGSNGGFGMSGK